MAAFASKVDEVLGEQISDYQEDAMTQKNIVATDFLTVLETTLFKIHDGLTDLTDAERQVLTDAMSEARNAFGLEVDTWVTTFTTASNQIMTNLVDDGNSMGAFDLRQESFAEDIDMTLVDWLTDYFEDLQGLIAQKKADETAIATAQTSDMTTWLNSHVEDLMTALQEVCK